MELVAGQLFLHHDDATSVSVVQCGVVRNYETQEGSQTLSLAQTERSHICITSTILYPNRGSRDRFLYLYWRRSARDIIIQLLSARRAAMSRVDALVIS